VALLRACEINASVKPSDQVIPRVFWDQTWRLTIKFTSSEWELHPEIAKRPHSVLIDKQLPGSFSNTPLESWLRERGIEVVTIAGYMTQMCCDTTAREAFHRGFAVEFLSDATGTLPLSNSAGKVTAEELHRGILCSQQMLHEGVVDTATWLEQLKKAS
jgi:nicotinamidase-related amidase